MRGLTIEEEKRRQEREDRGRFVEMPEGFRAGDDPVDRDFVSQSITDVQGFFSSLFDLGFGAGATAGVQEEGALSWAQQLQAKSSLFALDSIADMLGIPKQALLIGAVVVGLIALFIAIKGFV